jgi:thiosulfate dehydrogenase [quinone] large subunit
VLTGSSAGGLRALSLVMGVFLVAMGVDKIGWLTDDGVLVGRFAEWLETAPPASRWYLEHVAMPGAPLFSRLVPIAEMAAGVALLSGVRVRLAALATLVMVLNFHFASDVLFHYRYLTNGYGLPVVSGLLALAIGGARLPFSVPT